MYRYIMVLALAIVTFGCNATPAQPKLPLETLYGVTFEGDRIKFAVRSTGCTKAADLALQIEKSDDSTKLSVVRLKKDRCRKRPSIEWFSLPFSNDQTFELNNPMSVPF